ncbi:hypothetical protein FZX01_14795 [Listeria monocytogenes]|nr:hypothetical protein FZX01_14795 [Listeria monocytogenes]
MMPYRKDWKSPALDPMSALASERIKLLGRLDNNNNYFALNTQINSMSRLSNKITQMRNIESKITNHFKQLEAMSSPSSYFTSAPYELSAKAMVSKNIHLTNTAIRPLTNIGEQVHRLSKMDFRIGTTFQKIDNLLHDNESLFSELSDEQVKNIPKEAFQSWNLKNDIARNTKSINKSSISVTYAPVIKKCFIHRDTDSQNKELVDTISNKQPTNDNQKTTFLLNSILFVVNIISAPHVALQALQDYYDVIIQAIQSLMKLK